MLSSSTLNSLQIFQTSLPARTSRHLDDLKHEYSLDPLSVILADRPLSEDPLNNAREIWCNLRQVFHAELQAEPRSTIFVDHSGEREARCLQTGQDVSLVFVRLSTRKDELVTFVHEAVHSFGLTGRSVFDEGIAAFFENAYPVFEGRVHQIPAQRDWLRIQLRRPAYNRGPYALGSACCAAAIYLAGWEGLRNMMCSAWSHRDEYQLQESFAEIIEKARAVVATEGVPAGSESDERLARTSHDNDKLQTAYLGGQIDDFRRDVETIVEDLKHLGCQRSYLNAARLACILGVDPDRTEADRSLFDSLILAGAEAPQDVQPLFGAASLLAAASSAESLGEFYRRSRTFLKYSEDKLGRSMFEADFLLLLVQAHGHLPREAGGSARKARMYCDKLLGHDGFENTARRLSANLPA